MAISPLLRWLAGFEAGIAETGEYARGQRELIARLRQEFPGVGVKRSKPVQAELLPALVAAQPETARESSKQERIYRAFLEARKNHLEITVGMAAPPDETHNSAWVNVAVGRVLQALAEAGHPEPERGIVLLFEDYFAAPWPAKYTPPWPFRAFASEKVWRPMLAGAAQ